MNSSELPSQRFKEVTVALDSLVATLRRDRDERLAAILHHQVHVAAWDSREEQLIEIRRLLRNTQTSQVSVHSSATTAQIDTILADIDNLGVC
jgi:hypothetical protein